MVFIIFPRSIVGIMEDTKYMPQEHIQLVIVVNGQPVSLDANLHQPLRSVVDQALAKSGNSGQPPENWELRDSEGHLLDLSKRVGDFGFIEGTKLFLSLKAGVGGAILVCPIH